MVYIESDCVGVFVAIVRELISLLIFNVLPYEGLIQGPSSLLMTFETLNNKMVEELLGTIILSIRDVIVKRCHRRFGCETINPTQKFTSMNLLQMFCVIT